MGLFAFTLPPGAGAGAGELWEGLQKLFIFFAK
jgi:hypothetical protein